LNHPFVTGIGDGTLTEDRYEFFLKQDYIYLIEFSRIIAIGVAKANHLNVMNYFATLLQATLNIEMDLHRKTCAEFGISTEQLEKTEPAMITSAYTNLLLKTCYQGSFEDILAVLLPCTCGYVEIGKKLLANGLPTNRFYQDWINTYASKEFADFANWLIQLMNKQAEDAGEDQKERWYRLYRASARFEYLFFEMSWQKESWPNGIPR
jgi:thiaminase/transcriptional activator TenA